MFGSMQRSPPSRELHPLLIFTATSTGGVMGKMIDAANRSSSPPLHVTKIARWEDGSGRSSAAVFPHSRVALAMS